MSKKNKNPLSVGYAEMIEEIGRLRAVAEMTYPSLVAAGSMPAWTARRRRTVYEVLLQLLKKHEKNPQLNLADMAAQMALDAEKAAKRDIPPVMQAPNWNPANELSERYPGEDPDFYTAPQ